METRRSLSKRRSSALEEERDAVAKQVEEDHERAPRKRSSYLPSSDNINSRQGDSRLRDAKKAIQTIYDIHTRYERRRAVENASFLLAMTGISMVFIDNEYTESELSKLYLRIANCSATLVLLGLVVWRFVIERDILIKRNAVAPHIALWRMPKQLFKLLLELLVCCICVPPGVNGSFRVWEWKFYVDDGVGTCPATFTVDDGSCYLVYSYPYDLLSLRVAFIACSGLTLCFADNLRCSVRYEVLGILSLLRLYMLPRIIRNLSDFTNYRTSYLGVVYHVDTLSSLFAVKCFLRSHPFRFLLAAFAGTLVLTGYALAIVEAPVNPQLAPLWNSMWLVVLTMGTIGYGDLASVTIAGQVLLVLGGMLAGILLVGVLSAAIFGFLGLSERDRRFIHLLRRQEYNRHLKQASARTIQAVWHRYVFRKHGLHASDPKKYKQLLDKLYRCTSKQRSLRKRNIGAYDSASTEVQRCQDQLLLSFRQDHATTMQRLGMVEKRLDTLLVAATDAVSSA